MSRSASALLLLLAGCTIGLGDAPPEEISIRDLDLAPADAAIGEAVTVSWSVAGPARRLVLAVGDCACDVTGRTELVDACGERPVACLRLPAGEESCPCGTSAAGEVPYTLTALGPEGDETADVATRVLVIR